MDNKVAIIGSGVVGTNWATIFASSGFRVCMYDVNETALVRAKERVNEQLLQLAEHDLKRSELSTPQALANVTTSDSLECTLRDAIYAQESTVECVEFRRKLYAQIDDLLTVNANCIVASSSSTIPASMFTGEMRNRDRCLVAHPLNPPLYVPLTEIVPSRWTDEKVLDKCYEILEKVGQKPIRLRKEVVGFAVNRIQYSILAEAWRLVEQGVLSVRDVDKVIEHGLGIRYAFNGPMATCQMNADDVRDYFRRYGPAMQTVTRDLGEMPDFSEHSTVVSQMSLEMSGDDWNEKRRMRETALIEIAKLKKKLKID